MARPTKLSNPLIEIIKKLYILGKTDAEVCAIVGISKPTLYSWQKNNKELLYSIKEAKGLADSLVEASLFMRATGYTHPSEEIFCSWGKVTRVRTEKHYAPDVLAQIFWLKNRQPEKWRDKVELAPPQDSPQRLTKLIKKSFTEFCIDAGYPPPYQEQIDFVTWCLYDDEARMLLGSRGYGKTDYITILGNAYLIYCEYVDSVNNNSSPTFTSMIVTKTKERNAAILCEIAGALTKNGVELEKENSKEIRVNGLHGKDASAFGRTIKSSWRGTHPKLIIMDDPVTEEDTSEAMRKLVKKKYNEGFKLTANILIIGQPAHEHDLYAELRDKLKLKLVPHGTIKELDHDLEAQRLAGVDEKSIQASYHLKIISDGQNPFDGVKYIDKYPASGSSVAFIDPSHEGGDFTALTILKQHFEGIVVVGFIFKKAWHHCLDDMAPLLKKYGVERLCFETNALGQQPLMILQQAFTGIGIVGRRSNNNKHSRIMAAGAYSHLIHLARDSHKAYIDQVVQYEYNSKHDDAPDSLATCLEWIGLIRGKV